jgi:GNAT superfamily N-acetyltransferase
MNIELARVEELASLQELFEQAISWQRQKGAPTFASFSASFLEQEIRNGRIYVARNQSAMVGTVSLYEIDDPVWDGDREPALYIHRLASLRAEAGRGAGAALIRWSRQQAATKNKRWLRVDCWADNRELCRFYERQGFEKVRDKHTGENHELPSHYHNITVCLYQMAVEQSSSLPLL